MGVEPQDRQRERSDTVPLQSRWSFAALVAVLGCVVFAPAIRSSYLLDDYLQSSMVRGAYPVARRAFDLYNFVDDDSRAVLLDRGMLPWWSDPSLTIRFLRPLSSLLVWSEHKLLGDGPLLLHLHSMLWWAAAALGARGFFKRVLPARPATIASLIFALAPCHALPIAWLANREVLISLAFGAPALSAYVAFRGRGGVRLALAAALLFALSLAGGEYAICLAGYVVAFELFAPPTTPSGVALSLSRRVIGVSPFAIPAVVYLGLRRALGYGARGSGFYTDPLAAPLDFLRTAPRRFAVLVLDAWCGLDHETMNGDTPSLAVLAAFIALALALVVVLRTAHARIDAAVAHTATWLLIGALLALVPVLAVVPSPRLTGASMLGVAAISGLVLDAFWWRGASATPLGDGVPGTLVLLLGFAQLIHGPATSWLVGRHFAGSARGFASSATALRDALEDPRSAEVGVVRGMGGSFFAAFAVDPSRSPPARWRILAQTGHVLTRRRDARSLEVIAPSGRSIFPTGSENLYRSEHTPVAVGDGFDVQGMRVTILDLGPRGPRRVLYQFDRDLEDAPLAWIDEDRFGGFRVVSLPLEGFGAPFDP